MREAEVRRAEPGSPDGTSRGRPVHVDPWLTPGRPRLDRAWFQCLNLTYDKALSNVAFNCNLRRYAAVYVAFEFFVNPYNGRAVQFETC